MASQTTFIIKQSAIYGIGNTLAKLSGALLLPLYMVFTTEAEFGLIALFETIGQFLLAFTAFGAKGGLSRFYYECDSKSQKSFFFTSLVFITITSLICTILCFVATTSWTAEIFRIEVSTETLKYFSIAVFGLIMAEVPYIAMRLQQKAKQQTIHRCVNVIMTIAFTYIYLRVFDLGIKGVFMAQATANTLTLVGLLPCIRQNCIAKINTKQLSESIKYGMPLAISNVITIVLTLSDRHILNQLRSLEEVGEYSLAYKIANIIQMVVVTSFITSYTYFYYKSLNDTTLKQTHRNIFRLFIIAMTTIGFGLVAFRHETIFIVSLGKEGYFDSAVLIPYLVIGLLISGIRQIFTLPLTKLKLTKYISLVSISIAIINILLNFAFIPTFGKLGASFTTSIAQLAGCIVFYFMLKQKGEADFDIKCVFKCLFIFILFSIISNIIGFNGWIADISVNAILFLLFVASLFLFRVTNVSDISDLLSSMKHKK